MSIRKVALYAKVNQSQLGKFEAGKGDLTGSPLIRVMTVLGFQITLDGEPIDPSGSPPEPPTE